MEQALILASASPRRRELMAQTGVPFEVFTADAEEVQSGAPEELVMENARRKARAVAQSHPGRIVLGADTIVYQDGLSLGKPRDEDEARTMLRLLSGAWHTVYTGVCVICPDGREDTRFDVTRVLFTPMDEAAVERYVLSGEPMDKAGAYAIQGRGGLFVKRIEGSYSNVIGLPMALTREMLLRAGIENI